jgi:UDP-3-O-[3-hydroxymyristoyl] glucosamine N-acyltransferase
VRLPHIGTVRIRNDVEVGSLTTVCRGTLSDTLIQDGAKIDDHVHIAHNIHVGEHTFVIACAEVSGGVRIGQASLDRAICHYP